MTNQNSENKNILFLLLMRMTLLNTSRYVKIIIGNTVYDKRESFFMFWKKNRNKYNMSIENNSVQSLPEIRAYYLQNIVGILNIVEPFYILLVVVLGLAGNTISFFLFVLTKLR